MEKFQKPGICNTMLPLFLLLFPFFFFNELLPLYNYEPELKRGYGQGWGKYLVCLSLYADPGLLQLWIYIAVFFSCLLKTLVFPGIFLTFKNSDKYI